jgi:carbonic anhydrase
MRGALQPHKFKDFPSVERWLGYTNVYHREAEPSPEYLLTLSERNVAAQLRNLRSHPVVAARLAAGDLALHGWVYHIGTGTVTVYDEGTGRFLEPAIE